MTEVVALFVFLFGISLLALAATVLYCKVRYYGLWVLLSILAGVASVGIFYTILDHTIVGAGSLSFSIVLFLLLTVIVWVLIVRLLRGTL